MYQAWLMDIVVETHYKASPSNPKQLERDRNIFRNEKQLGTVINALCNGLGSPGATLPLFSKRFVLL